MSVLCTTCSICSTQFNSSRRQYTSSLHCPLLVVFARILVLQKEVPLSCTFSCTRTGSRILGDMNAVVAQCYNFLQYHKLKPAVPRTVKVPILLLCVQELLVVHTPTQRATLHYFDSAQDTLDGSSGPKKITIRGRQPYWPSVKMISIQRNV